MIAVFSKSEADYKGLLEVTPSKMFIRIKDMYDIRGRKFTGIIRTHQWFLNEAVEEAYDFLRMRQPELFD